MRPIADTLRNDPNDHYGTRHHKYTINIPLELMKQAQIKSRAAGFNEVAPYFRAILSREVLDGSLVLSDILGQKEFKRQEYIEKHRREGTQYPFAKVSPVKFLDKIRKIVHTFNRSKDQQFFEF